MDNKQFVAKQSRLAFALSLQLSKGRSACVDFFLHFALSSNSTSASHNRVLFPEASQSLHWFGSELFLFFSVTLCIQLSDKVVPRFDLEPSNMAVNWGIRGLAFFGMGFLGS